MSRGFVLSMLASALLGSLIVLPIWLDSFSAAEIVFGRYLVLGCTVVLIVFFRRDVFHGLNSSDFRAFLMIGLFGNILYYLFLAVGVRQLGGMAGCILVAALPVISWKSLNSRFAGTGSVSMLPLLLFMISAIFWLILSMTDSQAIERAGLVWLLLAGACWLWAAHVQAGMVRFRPELDASDSFLLSGLASLVMLAVLLPLAFLGESLGEELSLFGRHRSHDHWQMYWLAMLYAGLAGTVVARMLWRRAVLNASGGRIHRYTAMESLFAVFYIFALEGRSPGTDEWVITSLVFAGWLIFTRLLLSFSVMRA